jgi:hypothetical protein
MSDNDEFMTLATNTSPPPSDSDTIDAVFGRVRSPRDGDEDDDVDFPLSSLCQWSVSGKAFSPAPRTTHRLPPGIYKPEWDGNGSLFFDAQSLALDNLVQLPDSKSDEVIKEISRFWTLKDKFKQYGFIHKRGVLLWGPAGSGKSSTVMFVTKELVNSGGIVIIANETRPAALSSALATLRIIEPHTQMMVVLEDIDALIQRFGESEILSLLDGEASVDNVIFMATTNYPENLDGRVVNRPSRFDRVVKIGMPSSEARRAYLVSRKLELTDDEMDYWVEETADFSIAHLKEVIVGVKCFGGDFDTEMKRLRSMAKTPKSDDPKGKVGFGS